MVSVGSENTMVCVCSSMVACCPSPMAAMLLMRSRMLIE